MPPPDVSIVVPVFNEERSLPQLVSRNRRGHDPGGRRLRDSWVDDGSTDGSHEALRGLPAATARLRVLRCAQQRPVGGARRGIPARARGTW